MKYNGTLKADTLFCYCVAFFNVLCVRIEFLPTCATLTHQKKGYGNGAQGFIVQG